MPEEKITIELEQSAATAIVEALANCGDEVAEKTALEIRNILGNTPKATTFYWMDNDENELRLYAEKDSSVSVQIRDDDTGEWNVMFDMADQNFDDPIVVILDQLTSMLTEDEDEDEE